MTDYIASVDAGNGITNAIVSDLKSNRVRSVDFPSVRAQAKGGGLNLGKQFEMQYTYVDWEKRRYIVGDDVTRVTKDGLERHMHRNRYGEEFHQFLVSVALSKLGVKHNRQVDLTVFCPPGLYNDHRKSIENNFLNSTPVIHMKGKKTPFKWRYNRVTVWPEGLGALACFVLNDQGSFYASNVLAGSCVLLDIGAYTLDSLLLYDGNFNPESLETATWEKDGINDRVLVNVLRDVKQVGGADFTNMTIEDIDQVIRAGLVGGDYVLSVAGKDIDIQESLEFHSQEYARWIANNVIDTKFDGLVGISSLIIVGGGEPLVTKHLSNAYSKDKIVNRKKHETTKKVHPIHMNTVGGHRLALMELAKT